MNIYTYIYKYIYIYIYIYLYIFIYCIYYDVIIVWLIELLLSLIHCNDVPPVVASLAIWLNKGKYKMTHIFYRYIYIYIYIYIYYILRALSHLFSKSCSHCDLFPGGKNKKKKIHILNHRKCGCDNLICRMLSVILIMSYVFSWACESLRL